MADHRCMRTAMEAVDEMKLDLTGPAVPSSLLAAVALLVPSAEVAFVTTDHRRRRFVSQQSLVDGTEGFTVDIEATHQRWWPLVAATRTSVEPQAAGSGAVERGTAWFSAQDIASWPLSQHYRLEAGDLMCVEFPASAGQTRRLLLWRDAPDRFSAEEEAVVRLLRPHLLEVDRLARRGRDDARLTSREWQVLELVARGATNAEVATALVTSVATVRKHMEHIFDRTGVRTRSAAVAAVMPLREPVDSVSLHG